MLLTFTFHNPTQQVLISTSPYAATVCFGMYTCTHCHSTPWCVNFYKLSQYALTFTFTLSQNTLACISSHTATVYSDMYNSTNCHRMLWHVQFHKLPQYALTFISHSSHCHSILWHVQLNKLPQNAQACTILQTATVYALTFIFHSSHTATVCFDMYNLPHNVLACIIHKLPQTALACTHIQTATVGCVLYISSNYHSTLWYIYKPKTVYMSTHYISKQFKMCVH